MRRRRAQDGDDRLLVWKDRRRWRPVDSALVNEYVGQTTGLEVTAKDFRTWHATVIAAASLAASLAESGGPATKTARKRAVVSAMKEVAEFLGNTPALARSSYVDPRVVDAFEEGRTIASTTRRRFKTADARQTALERAVLRLLRE
jgi:DNA topoisomerase IB